MELSICPELAAFWKTRVPITTDAELEGRIIEFGGAHDAILVWQERGVIIDGHRRYGYCRKHNLPFRVRYISLPDLPAAYAEMDAIQNERRNIPPHEAAACLARRVDQIQTRKAEKLNLASSARMVSVSAAAKEVAAQQGVSPRTVERAVKRKEHLDTLPQDLRARLTSGEIRVSSEDLEQIAGFDPIQQRAIFQDFDTGEYGTIHEVLNGQGKASSDPVEDLSDEIEPLDPPPDLDYGGAEEYFDATNLPALDPPEDEPEIEPEQDDEQQDEPAWDEQDYDENEEQEEEVGDGQVISDAVVVEAEAALVASEAISNRSPRPSEKPIRDQIRGMFKDYGRICRALYNLRDQNPKRFVKINALLGDLGLELQAWEKEST